MKSRTKKIAILGILASFAMILSYLESLLPPITAAFPGIKMGLPNIVIVFTLYRLGPREAISVSLVRILCVALLFGNTMTLLYSLAGAALSLTLMILLKHFDFISPIGVSVVGGIMHNVGQILVAILVLRTPQIGYYLIVLTVTGTVAGLLVGLAGYYLVKRFPKLPLR